MPVVQLQDDTGENLGRALGTAAGFFATRKTRAADKAQRDREAEDTHANIQSEIAARTADTARADAESTNTVFQRGAYSKAVSLLASPPKGTDPQAWANSVWQKATTADPSNGGLGLTDPELQGKLYAMLQDTVGKAQAAKQQQFAAGLKYPPNWNTMKPQEQLAYLQQRLNAAERVQNKDVVNATNQEMGRIQNAINQANLNQHRGVTERQADQRISINLGGLNLRRAGGAGGADLSDRAVAVVNTALGAPNQKAALKILDQANLPRRDYTQARQELMDQFREPASHDTSGLSAAGTLQYNKDVRDWMTGGQDPSSEPDPSDPKYQKKSSALGAPPAPSATPKSGGGSNVGIPAGTDKRNGKAVFHAKTGNGYVYADGSTVPN
jgi:hypothetical protein